jgi:hypothetical protein
VIAPSGSLFRRYDGYFSAFSARGSRRLALPLTPAELDAIAHAAVALAPLSAWPSLTWWRASWLYCRKPRAARAPFTS